MWEGAWLVCIATRAPGQEAIYGDRSAQRSRSMSKNVLPTDQKQILTHQNIIRVGEDLRQQYQAAAEDSKQEAIRCAEEAVRREEEERRQQALAAARKEWQLERQQLFKEAHESQLRAIARQNRILEKKLRQEFADTIVQMQDENRQHLQKTIDKTWEEAEELRQKAIAETRREERAQAEEEARRVAKRVAGEKALAAELAARERAQALGDQREHLGTVQEQALDEQRQEMEGQFERRMEEVGAHYEGELAALRERLDGEVASCQRLEGELRDVTQSRDEWEQKHAKLKEEFSDFIDQLPGFRGDFLLK